MSDPAARERNVRAIEELVDKETTAALTRKGSLETRAASVVVASVGMITLFLTLRQALKLDASLLEWPTSLIVIISFGLLAVGFVAAVVTELPLSYPAAPSAVIRVILRDDIARDDLREEMIDARAVALATMTRSNRIKSWSLIVAFSDLLVAVAGFSWAIVTAAGVFG